MTGLVNHFVFDMVSLQIVAVVLLGFWLASYNQPIFVHLQTPRDYARYGGTLALVLWLLVGGTALYYHAPWLMVGKVGLWALHVGVLAVVRWRFAPRERPMAWQFFNEFSRFEAIASLGILFLR